MKLDYEFIKSILEAIEENEMSKIEGEELLSKLNVKEPNIKSSKEEIIAYDNMLEYIKLLCDSNIINSNSTNKYGLEYDITTSYPNIDGSYGLTLEGYNFLKGLKEDKVFF